MRRETAEGESPKIDADLLTSTGRIVINDRTAGGVR